MLSLCENEPSKTSEVSFGGNFAIFSENFPKTARERREGGRSSRECMKVDCWYLWSKERCVRRGGRFWRGWLNAVMNSRWVREGGKGKRRGWLKSIPKVSLVREGGRVVRGRLYEAPSVRWRREEGRFSAETGCLYEKPKVRCVTLQLKTIFLDK